MVLAPAPDTGQVCGCVYPAHWAAARPSPEPCQGDLLYRSVRSQWSRDGALTCSSVHPRSVSCPRTLQSRTPDPNAPDATVRVRGLGLRISTPDGQEWRSAMVNPPFFPVSTPQAFYELLLA